MSDIENRNVVIKLCNIIGTGRGELAADLLSPDLAWRTMRKQNPSIMTKEQLLGALTKEAALMKEGFYRFSITGMTVEGQRVAVEAEGFGTLPDGSTYEQIYHMLFIVRDGLIVEAREYYDSVHCDETIRRFWK